MYALLAPRYHLVLRTRTDDCLNKMTDFLRHIVNIFCVLWIRCYWSFFIRDWFISKCHWRNQWLGDKPGMTFISTTRTPNHHHHHPQSNPTPPPSTASTPPPRTPTKTAPPPAILHVKCIRLAVTYIMDGMGQYQTPPNYYHPSKWS